MKLSCFLLLAFLTTIGAVTFNGRQIDPLSQEVTVVPCSEAPCNSRISINSGRVLIDGSGFTKDSLSYSSLHISLSGGEVQISNVPQGAIQKLIIRASGPLKSISVRKSAFADFGISATDLQSISFQDNTLGDSVKISVNTFTSPDGFVFEGNKAKNVIFQASLATAVSWSKNSFGLARFMVTNIMGKCQIKSNTYDKATYQISNTFAPFNFSRNEYNETMHFISYLSQESRFTRNKGETTWLFLSVISAPITFLHNRFCNFQYRNSAHTVGSFLASGNSFGTIHFEKTALVPFKFNGNQFFDGVFWMPSAAQSVEISGNKFHEANFTINNIGMDLVASSNSFDTGLAFIVSGGVRGNLQIRRNRGRFVSVTASSIFGSAKVEQNQVCSFLTTVQVARDFSFDNNSVSKTSLPPSARQTGTLSTTQFCNLPVNPSPLKCPPLDVTTTPPPPPPPPVFGDDFSK